MRLLLVHQNFPGQFRQLAPFLLSAGHDLVAICSHSRPTGVQCRTLRYQEPSQLQGQAHCSTLAHEAFQRAKSVARLCNTLRIEGWHPDCIAVHSGWGESLALKEVWPFVPQVVWPELWLLPKHGGHGHDPQLPTPTLDHHLEQLGRNALTRCALTQAHSWVLPTIHQAESLPSEFKGSGLKIVHEGIDTNFAVPNPSVHYEVRGISVDRTVPTLTFVNRNLERLRGFDLFMRSLPDVMSAIPSLRVIIVGDSEKGYGPGHPSGRSLRDVLVDELKHQIDLERIHFLGRIPHAHLIGILQASWVHVYLSYPFVLGWSLLEAMACGCSIIASRGMPVEEVITDGVEGLLVGLQDPKFLASRVITLLQDSNLRQSLGKRARIRAFEWDQRLTLPKLESILLSAASSRVVSNFSQR